MFDQNPIKKLPWQKSDNFVPGWLLPGDSGWNVSVSAISAGSWWRHQMETFSALLTLCARNPLVTGEFPAKRPVTRSFEGFFHLCLNKRLSKKSRGWCFETLSPSLWRYCNGSGSTEYRTGLACYPVIIHAKIIYIRFGYSIFHKSLSVNFFQWCHFSCSNGFIFRQSGKLLGSQATITTVSWPMVQGHHNRITVVK